MVSHHAWGPAPQPPRRPTTAWEVAEVWRLAIEDSRRRDDVSPRQERVISDLMVCRTAHLGGHVAQCPACGCARYASNACRNRHGPTCPTFAKVPWLQARPAEWLQGPSFHPVFTLPHALHGLIQAHPRQLLSRRFHSVEQTLKPCGRQQLGGHIGAPLVLPIWDQTLGSHGHVHGLMPAGALERPSQGWGPSQPNFLVPVHALREGCRGKLVEPLHQAYAPGQWVVGTLATGRSDREAWRHLRDQRYANPWVL